MTHWAACRVDSISWFNFTPHIIWTFRHSCRLAVYKLKMEGKIKYFHSKTLLGLTDTVKSKINIQKRKIVNDHDKECYSKKKNQDEIYKMIIIAQCIYEST